MTDSKWNFDDVKFDISSSTNPILRGTRKGWDFGRWHFWVLIEKDALRVFLAFGSLFLKKSAEKVRPFVLMI